MKQLFSLILNPNKVISLSLLATVVVLGTMYAWERFEVEGLKNKLTFKELQIEELNEDRESCKKSMNRLILANKKKHTVIKEYEKKYHTGEEDAINNIDEFIDFASRLQ